MKLTVVLDYYEDMETYGRIGLLRSYGNFQSYWTIRTKNKMVFDKFQNKKTKEQHQKELDEKRMQNIHRRYLNVFTLVSSVVSTSSPLVWSVFFFFKWKENTDRKIFSIVRSFKSNRENHSKQIFEHKVSK